MQRQGHGVLSLFLVMAAMAVAVAAVWQSNALAALAYLAIIFAGSATTLYAYCAKCPCRHHNCGHLIPGHLTRLLPARRQGAYGPADYLAMAISLLAMILWPLPWLRHHLPALAIFGILLAVAGGEILLFVCRGCDNHRCPMRGICN